MPGSRRALSFPEVPERLAAWEGRWELIDGVAYDMTPAPSYEHQRISAKIGNLLFNQLEAGRYVEAAHGEWGGEIEVLGGTRSLTLGT